MSRPDATIVAPGTLPAPLAETLARGVRYDVGDSSALGFALLPAIFLFRLRDSLRAAEDRTFLQAWTLRQLVPSSGAAGHQTMRS